MNRFSQRNATSAGVLMQTRHNNKGMHPAGDKHKLTDRQKSSLTKDTAFGTVEKETKLNTTTHGNATVGSVGKKEFKVIIVHI